LEGETVVMTDIFEFAQTGVAPNGSVIGELRPTGIRPLFMIRLERSGFSLGAQVFMKGRPQPGQVETSQLKSRRRT
jgi:pilus assembly protein CpaF